MPVVGTGIGIAETDLLEPYAAATGGEAAQAFVLVGLADPAEQPDQLGHLGDGVLRLAHAAADIAEPAAEHEAAADHGRDHARIDQAPPRLQHDDGDRPDQEVGGGAARPTA